MKQFFKYVLATIVGVTISFFVVGFISFAILAGIATSIKSSVEGKIGDQEQNIKPNSILHVKLNHPIPEKTANNPFEHFDFMNFEPQHSMGLNDVLKNIRVAKNDQNIKGIYLDLSDIPAGLATLEEIREALIDFKETGKFIVSYGEIYSQRAYYLASVSDQIYINPAGLIELKGFSVTNVYFKNTLEKLGVKPEVFVNGKYKSATEVFYRESMSDANREQTSIFINSVYDHFINKIAKARNIAKDELNNTIDDFLIRKPEDAVTYKIADGARFEDEVWSYMKEKIGISEKDELELVSLFKYRKHGPKERKIGVKDKIAVIYASGSIVDGKGQEGEMGSVDMAEAIKDARENEEVQAVVLRVNSPGGSALASEVMWRELSLTKAEKPLIVSMGDMAASGGYYISCMADTIIAQPSTLTGSIGVWGLLMNAEDFYNKKLGFTFDGVKTAKHADISSSFLGIRELTDEEREIIQEGVDHVYKTFIKRVAEGRGTSKEVIHEIGQGRIWSGVTAKEIGLVDLLGNVEDAIAIAAYKAGLEEYKIETYPKPENPFEKFVETFEMQMSEKFMTHKLGDKGYDYYQYIDKLTKQSGVQARMPFMMEIR